MEVKVELELEDEEDEEEEGAKVETNKFFFERQSNFRYKRFPFWFNFGKLFLSKIGWTYSQFHRLHMKNIITWYKTDQVVIIKLQFELFHKKKYVKYVDIVLKFV